MDTMHSIKVRFWGVRGSYPTPGADRSRYGGNTACVEIEAGDTIIIFDAGTGIIPLGQSLVRRIRENRQRGSRPLNIVLLFSHLHHDHTQGFPFFAPAFIPGTNLYLYGPDFLGSSPRKTFEEIMQPPYFPVRLSDLNATLNFGVARETDTLLIGESADGVKLCPAGTCPETDGLLRVKILRSYAHPAGVLHYRIDWHGSSVVYATDTEGYVSGDRRLANFASGADLLIHDAQYTDEHYLGMLPGASVTQGYGHSTISMACHAAHAAGVKRLALFHHAPEYNDQQLDEITVRAQQIFPQTVVASEGLEICLGCPTYPQASLVLAGETQST